METKKEELAFHISRLERALATLDEILERLKKTLHHRTWPPKCSRMLDCGCRKTKQLSRSCQQRKNDSNARLIKFYRCPLNFISELPIIKVERNPGGRRDLT
ncbi:hypothetical protein P378_16800 [Desulforamulus profundi]|uniref:Uncharacterized protein n=1 Tax=Desulforamulus profundi TaxID=1383067 RepID=A0A2C6L1T7_9FIRM|nr:hypothetical protein [Desulforamulus profundi]PHJ37351.1 hypothetical protein P378_16800 [Desulforamulus profundi]